jgi:hypothetical protein
MHATKLLEQFRTGETGTVLARVENSAGADGKSIEFEMVGDVYRMGVGDGVIRLLELLELRRQRSSFWYRFLYGGRYANWELDISIKRLRAELNEISVGWTE